MFILDSFLSFFPHSLFRIREDSRNSCQFVIRTARANHNPFSSSTAFSASASPPPGVTIELVTS
jgi:hypothetical protein